MRGALRGSVMAASWRDRLQEGSPRRDDVAAASSRKIGHSLERAMLDLVIRSDRVVTPHGVGAWDVAIQGEKIVAVARARLPGCVAGDVLRGSFGWTLS